MKPSIDRKLLLAIDNSPATWSALEYVGRLAGKDSNIQIELFHATAPVPPELREFRGAENPQKEKQLDRELDQRQDRWEERAVQSAQPLLDKARLMLERAGVKAQKIQSQTVPLLHREDLIDEILNAAKQNGCDTVVVGRNAFPWLKEIFVSHVWEKLAEKAQGVRVTVID